MSVVTSNLCQAISTLHFVVKERPAILDAFTAYRGKSYLGKIDPAAKVCWVSFPGKFQEAWESLISKHNEDSVACVFLDDPEHGLGHHHHPDPQNPEKCLCEEIYGKRDYKALGYLLEKKPLTERERQTWVERAEAMHAHLEFLDTQFKLGDSVEAFWDDNNTFVKAAILQAPDTESGERDMTWRVQCKKSGSAFDTIRVRHTTDIFEKLLMEFGEEGLKELCENAIGIKVQAVEETRLATGAPCLAVQLVQRIQDAHRLRDCVLSDDAKLALTLNQALAEKLGVSEELAVHKTLFFEEYAKSLLKFSELTEHQKEKLQEMISFPKENIHLIAPAGGGKTFVALRYVLTMINKLGSSSRGKILYVSPNRALIYHFIQWLLTHAKHMQKSVSKVDDMNHLLHSLVVMHAPDTTLMNVRVRDGAIVLEPCFTEPEDFSLAVFDEAHETLRENNQIFEFVRAQRKILLSDLSQSSVLDNRYPAMRQVTLTQVVRSTKRVVLGANAFRMDDGNPVSCLGTTGPPLKSFLFEAQGDQEPFLQFAIHTMKALWHLVCTYPSVQLDQHVALLVPDMNFRDNFKPHLLQAFTQKFCPSGNVRLLSFEESLCYLPGCAHRSRGEDKLILDSDQSAKGLEMLFVVCIGLDSRIEGHGDNVTRARLYHALTRAQLQALVVDNVVRGGWLEYLTTLKLKGDRFTEPVAAAETRKGAATNIVMDAWLSATNVAMDAPLGSETPQDAATNVAMDAPLVSETPQDAAPNVAMDAPLASETPQDAATNVAMDAPLGSETPQDAATNVAMDAPLVSETPQDAATNVVMDAPLASETPQDAATDVAMDALFDLYKAGINSGPSAESKGPGSCTGLRDEDIGNRPAIVQAAEVGDAAAVRQTALKEAARQGHVEVLSALAAAGATVLHLAAANGHVAAVTRLLDLGARVAPRDYNGNTPLHRAALAGQKDVVQRLAAAKAPLDSKNRHGRAPRKV
eukprot:Skav214612  [mRNA]  locus=scaffold57:1027803:1034922:- [translate_table: standard]